MAKRYGIRAGLRFADALKLCPSLQRVNVDEAKILAETKAIREVFYKYTDKIIPYGLDESWLVMDAGVSLHEAMQVAELIKLEIWYSLELSASVGISDNLIFSKLGSDYRKPNGLTVITNDNYKEIVWPIPIKNLLFVGEVRERVARSCGYNTIGDIANADPMELSKQFRGKIGYDLWRFANGDDGTFHPEILSPGSIGNTITPPADMRNSEEVSAVIYLLARAVSARLKKHQLKAGCVSIHMKDDKYNTLSRQQTLEFSTDNATHIFNIAFRLFTEHYSWTNAMRSVGVSTTNLDENIQLSLFNRDKDVIMDIEINGRLRRLTDKFGELQLESAGALGRW